jgi:hypothetical protein
MTSPTNNTLYGNHVAQSVKDFVTAFFVTSDEANTIESWAAFFHEDANLVVGKDSATGATGTRMPG